MYKRQGYTPIDERNGRVGFDAQETSANTNDLRGKILRIKPLADGSYEIPDGNLFTDITEGLPEIYAMGVRNPFRIAISNDNYLYFGDVGPDGGADNSSRGPQGHDEFNRTNVAANFGWPFCIADNQSYVDFDFQTGQSTNPFNCENPVNDSPNNTGSRTLPTAQPAWIWYPYGASSEFPALNEGNLRERAAMAGAVYDFNSGNASSLKFPEYYDRSVFLYEWSRNWIREVKLDENGEVVAMNPFLTSYRPNRPIDMHFGPDGAMYIVEWGTGFFGNNPDARIVRIAFKKDGRAPIAIAEADKQSGIAPLVVNFDASASFDLDPGNFINYEWDFNGDGQIDATTVSETFTYTVPGNYDAILKLTDNTGLVSFASLKIIVGNNQPEVEIISPPDGGFFFWGEEIDFKISVEDVEDGNTEDRSIDCDDVVALPSIGHNDHSHDANEINTCEGSFVTSTHGDEADDVFYVFKGSYTDEGVDTIESLQGVELVLLQPKIKEAEFFTNQRGIQTEATSDPLGGNINVGFIERGDFISFHPVNLTGITHITFRAASAGVGGWVEARLNSSTGPLVGRRFLPVTGGWQTWDYFTMPIQALEGTHELFFAFSNSSFNSLFNINWIEFHGKGVSKEDYFELNGLKASYYNSSDFSGTPVMVKDPMIAFDWESESPIPNINADNFSVEWETNLVVDETRNYSLFSDYRNGDIQVFLNGEMIIDDSGGGTITSLSRQLVAGEKNSLIVRYSHGVGTAAIALGFGRNSTIHQLNYVLEEAVTVSVNESAVEKLREVQIYPNPFDDEFQLQIMGEPKLSAISLYQIDGTLLKKWKETLSEIPINLSISEFPDGFYSLKIENDSGVYTKKLLKF